MKNKILIVLFVVLVIILVTIVSMKSKKASSPTNQETSKNPISQANTVSSINSHGENTGIYVGVTESEGNENYLYISTNINKKASQEEQIRSLISAISESTGYQIDINSVNINDNRITIDLAKTAAPFELVESYQDTGSQKYYITADYVVAKTLFDSINKTLKSYFGSDTKVYLSADSQDIHIENEILKIDIDATKPYDEQ